MFRNIKLFAVAGLVTLVAACGATQRGATQQGEPPQGQAPLSSEPGITGKYK